MVCNLCAPAVQQISVMCMASSPFVRAILVPLMCGVLCLCVLRPRLLASDAGGKPWTAEASIAMKYILEPDLAMKVHAASVRPVMPSPDGSKFAIITRRGDLSSDENTYELIVYDTEAVTKHLHAGGSGPPAPLIRIERASPTLVPAIGVSLLSSERWSEDGSVFYFTGGGKGDRGDLVPQHFSLSVTTGKITKLARGSVSSKPTVLPRVVARSRGAALYLDYGDAMTPVRTDVEYPAEVVLPSVIRRILSNGEPNGYPNENEYLDSIQDVSNSLRRWSLYLTVDGMERRLADLGVRSTLAVSAIEAKISPNEKWAIIVSRRVPVEGWTASQDRHAQSETIGIIELLNIETGELLPLLQGERLKHAMSERLPQVLWGKNNAILVIANALAWSAADGSEVHRRIRIYDISERRWLEVDHSLEENEVVDMGWSDSCDGLLINWRTGSNPGTLRQSTFLPKGGKWVAGNGFTRIPSRKFGWEEPVSQEEYLAKQSDEAGVHVSGHLRSRLEYPPPQAFRFSNGLTITLDEAPDRPQKLVASLEGKRAVLIDCGADVEGTYIAPGKTIEWRDSDGVLHRGLLTMPRDSKGVVPLVVLLGSYRPNVFRPDGHTFGGHAPQWLAARGLAVLDVAFEVKVGSFDNLAGFDEEVMRNLEVVYGGIDAAAKFASIDTTRIGIVGFSRAGYIARQALLREGRYRFSAAVANDSYFPSLGAYYYYVHNSPFLEKGRFAKVTAAAHGGMPWHSLSKWAIGTFELGANRASGALLDIYHTDLKSPIELLCVYTITAPMMAAGRPVEMVALPDAGHQLVRPRQRHASMTANVDWLDFWLKGGEDSSPEKRSKYIRWRRLRARWLRQQAWEAAGHPTGSIPDNDFGLRSKAD